VSLRTRLLVGLGVVALVLGGVALAVTRSAKSYLVGQVDDRLPTHVDDQWDRGGGWANGPATDATPNGGPPLSPYYVGLVDGDSVEFVQDPDVRDPEGDAADAAAPDIDADQARRAAAAGQDGHVFTVGSDSADRFRVRAIEENGQVWVVATSLADVDAAVSRLVTVEVVATGVVLALLALVAFWVLRLGVRPLKSMARTATTVASGADLSQRVPDAPAGTEAGDLGTALNTMLARLETAFADQQASEERLRRFVADASHELRTPVATIRGYAELYRRGALDDTAQLDQAMRRTEAEVRRMGDLVDDMLLLARLDQGRPLEQGPVDLGVLAVDAAADARAMAPGRPVRASIEEGVVVEGDEHRLRQVVANLVRNAIVHTPPETAITVAACRRDGNGIVEVRDEGPGMPPDQAARAFERFYRADPGRARDRGGSGLGLAIVRAVAVAHRGSATLVSAPGVGTTVTIEIPLPAASLAIVTGGIDADG
jgi:two-component system, OmpR family, sensor kinase